MKKIKCLYLSLYMVCSFFALSAKQATILIDMSGVLVKTSGFRLARTVGLGTFIGFYNPGNVEPQLMSFLDTLKPRLPETPHALCKKRLMPQIMCDWLMGFKSNHDIRLLIQNNINKENIFKRTRYKKIVKGITDVMFDAKKFAKTIKPIKKGVNLLQALHNKGHKIIITSNWDQESFSYMLKRKSLQKIFSLCDDYVISGEIGLMKPDPALFYYVFDTYDIDPNYQTTVFIDDRQENITAAQSLAKKHLHCLICKDKDFKSIKKQLKKLNIL